MSVNIVHTDMAVWQKSHYFI